jgi:DNA-binding response OmpR family regulator
VRVLVVEDERRAARFIRRALVEEGFAVDLCGDGNEALDLISGTRFDAIILDVMLPGRDGLNVLKTLRSRSISTPVLILTARGSVNERTSWSAASRGTELIIMDPAGRQTDRIWSRTGAARSKP